MANACVGARPSHAIPATAVVVASDARSLIVVFGERARVHAAVRPAVDAACEVDLVETVTVVSVVSGVAAMPVHGVSSGTSRGEMMAAIRRALTHCSFGTGCGQRGEETMTLVRPRASLPCRIRCPRIGVPCRIGRVGSSLVCCHQLMASALLVPVTAIPLTVAFATMKYGELDFLSILHPAKVATPLDVETGLAVHVRFPEGLPPVNESVTGDTGAVVRTLPPASTILITGCVAKKAACRLSDGCVVNDSAAAGPTVMLNDGLLTVTTEPTVAVKVYPVPALSILQPANVAVPVDVTNGFVVHVIAAPDGPVPLVIDNATD